MSRDNNIELRAQIDADGDISGIHLGDYSGAGGFILRIYQLARGDRYWYVQGNGYVHTFVAVAEGIGEETTDYVDIDELGFEILRDWRACVLHRRDQQIRDLIERLSTLWGNAGDLPTPQFPSDEWDQMEADGVTPPSF